LEGGRLRASLRVRSRNRDFCRTFCHDKREENAMAAISKELMEVEKGFWTGGEDYYKAHLDKECLVAFPEMAGAMGNAEIAATVKEGRRWQNLKIDAVDELKPNAYVAIITYNVSATKEGGEPYAALVSTGYVKRRDGWKMMFHSQTPREAA
jgi:hypothetical protein